MKQETIDLIKYRLEKSKNTLLDAKNYFETATANSTVNRIYYAVFYAVSGLLLTKQLSSPKHSGVKALFNREFINTGLVEIEWGKFYSDMLDNRQEGDYKDFVEFQKEEVKVWLDKAELFIEEIEKAISKI